MSKNTKLKKGIFELAINGNLKNYNYHCGSKPNIILTWIGYRHNMWSNLRKNTFAEMSQSLMMTPNTRYEFFSVSVSLNSAQASTSSERAKIFCGLAMILIFIKTKDRKFLKQKKLTHLILSHMTFSFSVSLNSAHATTSERAKYFVG